MKRPHQTLVFLVACLWCWAPLAQLRALPLWGIAAGSITAPAASPIAYVEADAADFSATRSPVVNYPTPVANDIWIAIFCATDAADWNGTVPASSGWTKLNQGSGSIASETAAIFWKRSDGGEAATQTWTDITAANETGRVVILVYRNCKTSGSPINASGTPVAGGSVAAHNCPSVTSSVNNCMIVGILCIDPGSATRSYVWDSPATERIDHDTTVSGMKSPDAAIYVGDSILATAGSLVIGGTFNAAEHAAKFSYALEPQ